MQININLSIGVMATDPYKILPDLIAAHFVAFKE